MEGKVISRFTTFLLLDLFVSMLRRKSYRISEILIDIYQYSACVKTDFAYPTISTALPSNALRARRAGIDYSRRVRGGRRFILVFGGKAGGSRRQEFSYFFTCFSAVSVVYNCQHSLIERHLQENISTVFLL